MFKKRIVFSTNTMFIPEEYLEEQAIQDRIIKDKYEYTIRLADDTNIYDFDIDKYLDMYTADESTPPMSEFLSVYAIDGDQVNIIENPRLTDSDWHQTGLQLARHLAAFSKCQARKVGAVIINDVTHSIVSSGINGTISGRLNCNDVFRKINGDWYRRDAETGAFMKSDDPEVHHKWAELHEIHAEMNAISNLETNLKVNRPDTYTLYVTHTPCFNCAKSIVRADIDRVVILETYEEDSDAEVFSFFAENDIEVIFNQDDDNESEVTDL